MKDSDATMITPENEMTSEYQDILISFLLQMADDELIFGHRSSEWLGIAPDLEEDIAFSSIAQDEIGHAALFYAMVERLTAKSADISAFFRAAPERLNARLLEKANGDWAYTIARSYFYNVLEQVRLDSVLTSSYIPLQQAAAKILREERYHLLHMQTWFENLAMARGEARTRLQTAILEIWTDAADLFHTGTWSAELVEQNIFPLSERQLFERWEHIVKPVFEKVHIDWPGEPKSASADGRKGQHTEELNQLLMTMTEVLNIDTQANW